MTIQQTGMTHSVQSNTLADILERVLDKGVVIVGDIKIKIADVELLTIQIRLMIASVDKAKEIGMDWWVNNPFLSSKAEAIEREAELQRRLDASTRDLWTRPGSTESEVADLKKRIEELEAAKTK